MIDKANYTRALIESVEVLKKHNIDRAPIDLKTIVVQIPNLKVCSYSFFSKNYGCTIEEIIEFLESDLGAISRDPRTNNFIIYYNDTKNNEGLDRFTISHELGHYFLNHFSLITEDTLSRGGFSKKHYNILEKEANCFARNLLAPVPLYNKIIEDPLTFTWRTMQTFDISYDAAKTRKKLLRLDACRITKGHTDYFNTYKMPCFDYCKVCGNSIYETFNFCPICGIDNIQSIWEEDYRRPDNLERNKYMLYKEYEIHEETNKLKTCLVCGNENTNIEGEYCQICGKILVNKCDNRYQGNGYDNPCGKSVPSNARYCPYCSNPTTFFNSAVLKEWKEEVRETDETAEIEAMIPDEDPTYDMLDRDIEEELPFI